MKKVLLVLLIVITGYLLYEERDVFRDSDIIKFSNTHDSIRAKVKVYAFINRPHKVEYKNNMWTGDDGTPGILVYDRMKSFGLAKGYEHADLYLTIDDKFFYNSFGVDKAKPADVYDIEFSVNDFDTSYVVSGRFFHKGRIISSFTGHNVARLSKRLEVTYYRDEGKTKTEWYE